MSLRDGLVTHHTVAQRYDHAIERGEIREDPAQRPLIQALDRLIDDIAAKRMAVKSSALGWLFGKRREGLDGVRGLYVHGGVGRGKTMLMDMFFALVPVKRKRRAHFNDFMADVHDRITRHRAAVKAGEAKGDDPIPPVAATIAADAWVLCFDEFTVTDIADAMILSRLFSALFSHGVVLVATSNVAPDDLYRDGLNRQLFLPFVDTLKKHAQVLPLDSPTDHRLEKLGGLPVYMSPLGAQADEMMDRAWHAATEGAQERAEAIPFRGRSITVPRAAHRAARFTFAELCEAPLGAADYLAITDRYDLILVDHVPILDQTRRSATKRFILLIDTLYDRRKRLVASAEAPPEQLYAGRPGVTEAFEFDRTVSRLIEMRGRDWPDGDGSGGEGQAA